MLKSFERQNPPMSKKIANWEVGQVLEFWAKTQNSVLDISRLTTKTVFLTALATGARRGELWALKNEIKQVQKDPLEVEIPFQEDFFTKTHFTRKDGKTVRCLRIPALSGLGQENICPVSCLYSYVERSKTLRNLDRSSLFVPLNPDTDKMTKQFISAHVIRAINMAYRDSSTGTPSKVRAHDVRSISTSLRVRAGASLDDVMQAGHWSNPSTFFKYYQTRMQAVQDSPLHKLKYFVAAGKVINSSLL